MPRTYRINEIFYSLQGEGFWTGTPAVFVRFSACNLRCPFCDTDFNSFSELTVPEIISAAATALAGQKQCRRTPFSGNAASLRPLPLSSSSSLCDNSLPAGPSRRVGITGPPEISDLRGVFPGVDTPSALLPPSEHVAAASGAPMVVLTGGEPGLQVDAELVEAFHQAGFRVHIETNGTRALPEGIDWVTLSPKSGLPGVVGDAAVVLERADEIKVVFSEGDDPSRWAAFPATWHFLQPCDAADVTKANTVAAIRYCQEHPLWRLSLQTHKLLGIR